MSTDLVEREKVVRRTRGTSNRDERGNTTQRRKRREWVFENFKADVTYVRLEDSDGEVHLVVTTHPGIFIDFHLSLRSFVSAEAIPTVRCYRCGNPLHEETMTIDRINTGVDGGQYKRWNIRPACSGCNESTGGALATQPRKSPLSRACSTCGAKRWKTCKTKAGKYSRPHSSRRC